MSLDTSKWYERLWASFVFFTRLPFWRLYQPPKEAYRAVVEHWPLTGWLTGGTMAAVLFFGSEVLPYGLSVLLAIVVRLLLTGALHEDGLADFMDGFGGGGTDRRRTLDIMKDSHIGTYGVIGLVLYFLLLWTALSSLQRTDAALAVMAVDPYAKMVTAQLVQMMPYARTEGEAKSGTVYRRFSPLAAVSLSLQGLLPMGLYAWHMSSRQDWQMVIFLPAVVMYLLYLLIWRRLRGYTGDCCGAVFLLVELSAYLVLCHYLA